MTEAERLGRKLCEAFREAELELNPDMPRNNLLRSYDESEEPVKEAFNAAASRFREKLEGE